MALQLSFSVETILDSNLGATISFFEAQPKQIKRINK